MEAEMRSISKNNTWSLVHLPVGKTPISAKWVYKVKDSEDGKPPVFKARLVARGFEQRGGFDYQETFAPVVKWTTLRCVIALASQHQWNLHHLDVKTAFLNGELKEQVFMSQPMGFTAPGMSTCNPVLTPMEERLELTSFMQGDEVDGAHYRSIVGKLIH
ncbi:hypothetical protein R1sor_013081 [Riccia sorocarpa]|uniref:Reverse transcriptase Ty1/copia-type domain-containing protein n=1 Tax=Riccia sorocarpa TaxID=122646 RepID=A0ABD3H8F0_9MARC